MTLHHIISSIKSTAIQRKPISGQVSSFCPKYSLQFYIISNPCPSSNNVIFEDETDISGHSSSKTLSFEDRQDYRSEATEGGPGVSPPVMSDEAACFGAKRRRGSGGLPPVMSDEAACFGAKRRRGSGGSPGTIRRSRCFGAKRRRGSGGLPPVNKNTDQEIPGLWSG